MPAGQPSNRNINVNRRKNGRVARMSVGGKICNPFKVLLRASVGVWPQLRGKAVALDQPYLPISKVIEQFLVGAPPHVALPPHLVSINICFLVYHPPSNVI